MHEPVYLVGHRGGSLERLGCVVVAQFGRLFGGFNLLICLCAQLGDLIIHLFVSSLGLLDLGVSVCTEAFDLLLLFFISDFCFLYLGVGVGADLLDIIGVVALLPTLFTFSLPLTLTDRLRSPELRVLFLISRLGLFDLVVCIRANSLELGLFFLVGGFGPLNLCVGIRADLFNVGTSGIPAVRGREFLLQRLLVLFHRLDQFVRNLELGLFLVQLGLERGIGALLRLRRRQLLLHRSVRSLRPLNLRVGVDANLLRPFVRRLQLRAQCFQLVLQLLGLVRLRVGGIERGGGHRAALQFLPLQRRLRLRHLRLERLDALVQLLRPRSLRRGCLRVGLFLGSRFVFFGSESVAERGDVFLRLPQEVSLRGDGALLGVAILHPFRDSSLRRRELVPQAVLAVPQLFDQTRGDLQLLPQLFQLARVASLLLGALVLGFLGRCGDRFGVLELALEVRDSPLGRSERVIHGLFNLFLALHGRLGSLDDG